jgi:hypothetical protein
LALRWLFFVGRDHRRPRIGKLVLVEFLRTLLMVVAFAAGPLQYQESGGDHVRRASEMCGKNMEVCDAWQIWADRRNQLRMPIAAVGVTIVYERLLASPITNRHVPSARFRTIVPFFFGPA